MGTADRDTIRDLLALALDEELPEGAEKRCIEQVAKETGPYRVQRVRQDPDQALFDEGSGTAGPTGASIEREPGRTAPDIASLEYKLGKRGFRRDPRPIPCDRCGERAVFLYALKHTRLGGRTIEWCHHCQTERSWRRPGGGDREEDEGFNLERFLS